MRFITIIRAWPAEAHIVHGDIQAKLAFVDCLRDAYVRGGRSFETVIPG